MQIEDQILVEAEVLRQLLWELKNKITFIFASCNFEKGRISSHCWRQQCLAKPKEPDVDLYLEALLGDKQQLLLSYEAVLKDGLYNFLPCN